MRIATVIGIVLIGLGVLSLAYFTSPVGFLFQGAFNQKKNNLVPPLLGGIALISGVALPVAVQVRK
jgi:hypothetical protein